MVNFIEFSLVMCCFLPVLFVGDSEAHQRVKCNTLKICDQCIQNFGCAWCDKPDTGLDSCQDEKEAKCSTQFLLNPISRIIEESGNNSKNHKNTEAQVIHIELRPSHPLQVNVTFHHIRNDSLDIYLLQNTTTKCAKDLLNLALVDSAPHQCKKIGPDPEVYKPYELKISCSSSNKTSKCQGSKIDDKVQFQLEIELLSCPTDKSQLNQSFFIQSSGMDEIVTFNLSMRCQCFCEPPNKTNVTEKQIFNPGDEFMIEIDHLAKEVVNSTLAKNESIIYSSNIIIVQANMTSITWQDKKNGGPEVTIPKSAIDPLPINTNIKIVVFKDENLTKIENDIVVVQINESSKENPEGVLRIRYERKNLKPPNNPRGNWKCVYWEYKLKNTDQPKWRVSGITTKLTSEFIICSSTHLSAFSVILDPLNLLQDESYSHSSLHEYWLTKLSVIGSWITICFLILVLVIHYQKRIEKETTKILLNSSSALLLTHASYQIYTFLSGYVHCSVINFMTHYFVLAFLLWTASDGINMWRILFTDIFNTRGYVFYKWYKIISWGIPLVTSSIGVILPKSHLDDQKCELKFNTIYDRIFYMVPCMSILCCNMLLFTWMFIKATCRKSLGRVKDKKIDYVLALSQVFGIGWCIAFPFLCFPSTHLAGDYIFAAVISTQGLLIFIVRCGNNIKNLKKKLKQSTLSSSSMSTWFIKISRSSTDLVSTPLHSIDHAPTPQEKIAEELNMRFKRGS